MLRKDGSGEEGRKLSLLLRQVSVEEIEFQLVFLTLD
jgi:hypothetical protein